MIFLITNCGDSGYDGGDDIGDDVGDNGVFDVDGYGSDDSGGDGDGIKNEDAIDVPPQ